jgi:uncharacterized membrane protein
MDSRGVLTYRFLTLNENPKHLMQVAGRRILRAWPRLGIVALLVAVGFGAADVLAPARPAPEPIVYVGSIELAGRHIPLPEGAWLQAGLSNDSAGPAETRPYGAIETVVLFKLVERAVDSFITIRANSLPVEGGWGPAIECGRDDIHFVSVFYLSAHESLCGVVNHVVTARAAGSSPAWVEALQLARVRGWALPETWLMAGFRITNRHDLVDLHYHLNPQRGGFPPDPGEWATSAWSPAAVAQAPPRKAVVDRLAAWVMESSGPMQQIGTGRREALLPPLPAVENSDAASTTVAGAEQSAPWGISAVKMALWAVLSNTVNVAVNYVYTSGAPIDTGVLSAVQFVTHPLVNYANEMIWETLGAATRPLPPLDFPTAGIAAPGIRPVPLDADETGAAS